MLAFLSLTFWCCFFGHCFHLLSDKSLVSIKPNISACFAIFRWKDIVVVDRIFIGKACRLHNWHITWRCVVIILMLEMPRVPPHYKKKLFLVADFNTTLRSQNDWTHSLVYLANEREGCLFLFGVIPRKKKSLIVLLSFIFTFFSVSGKSPKAQNSDLVNYKSFVQYLDWKQQRKTASKLPLFSEEGRDLSRY